MEKKTSVVFLLQLDMVEMKMSLRRVKHGPWAIIPERGSVDISWPDCQMNIYQNMYSVCNHCNQYQSGRCWLGRRPRVRVPEDLVLETHVHVPARFLAVKPRRGAPEVQAL